MSMPIQHSDRAGNGSSAAVSLVVRTASRTLRPTHVDNTQIIFADPPHFVEDSAMIEVIVDGRVHAREVRILPHEVDDRRIPVELVDQKASVRRIA